MSFFLRLSGSGSAPNEYAFPTPAVYFNNGSWGEGVVTAFATASELDNNAGKGKSLRFYVQMLQSYPYRCVMFAEELGKGKFVSASTARDTPGFSTTVGPGETFSVERFDAFSDDVRINVPSLAAFLRLEYSVPMGCAVLKPRTGAATSQSNIKLVCDTAAGAFIPGKKYYIGTKTGAYVSVSSNGTVSQAGASGADCVFVFEAAVGFPTGTFAIKSSQYMTTIVISSGAVKAVANASASDCFTTEPAYDNLGRFLFITAGSSAVRQLAYAEAGSGVSAPFYDGWEETFHTFQVTPAS